MKKLGKIFVLCVLATFIAGAAMAQVELAEDHTGDVLIFPVYAADGSGWDTKITVINTSHIDSVVAKVVVRGRTYSQELLDFFIYLSPNDVWTAKVYNDNGTVKVYSDDDSVLSNVGVWADESPMDQAVQDLSCENEDFGYITVYEAWNDDVPDLTNDPKVDKDLIFNAFVAAQSGFDGAVSNALYGKYEVRLTPLDLSAAENAVILQDYDVNSKLALGAETFLGQNTDTTVGEVEALLAKEEVYMPYYNAENITAHLFTFPTKKTTLNADCSVASMLGPFWNDVGAGETYLEENSPESSSPVFSPVPEGEKDKFCEEFNVRLANFQYDEGWALYTFQLATFDPLTYYLDSFDAPFEFTGAPVIPLVVNLGADGLSLHEPAFEFGSLFQTELREE
jgi:hypothetical protein